MKDEGPGQEAKVRVGAWERENVRERMGNLGRESVSVRGFGLQGLQLAFGFGPVGFQAQGFG